MNRVPRPVYLRTARAIGILFTPEFLLRADRVFE